MASVTQKTRHRSMTEIGFPVQDEPRPPRKSRVWKLTAVAAALLVAIVWLAPMIVAHSPMLGWIISGSAASLNGSVKVGSASLGWFSPIGLSNVEVRDKDGQLVAVLPDVQGDRALVSLAFNHDNLGSFRLVKPQLNVVLDDKGTNVQRLIAKYLEPGAGGSTGISIVIVDGTVVVEDISGSGKTNWKIENLKLDFTMPDNRTDPMTLATSGAIHDGQQTGQFDIELFMPAAGSELAGDDAMENRLAMKLGSLPLEKMSKLISRFASDTELAGLELAGQLDSKIDCRWPTEGFSHGMSVNMDTSARGLRLATPRLSGDRLSLDSFSAVGDVNWRDGRFVVERASVDCDLGRLALLGRIEVDSKAGADTYATYAAGTDLLGPLEPYMQQSFKLEGNLDIARLATMLPNTFHIHKQTTVSSGNLTVELSSQKGKDGMVWAGRVETSDLTAMRRGRELVWQQPIAVTFNAHQSQAGPVIEELRCNSTFLNVQAAGWRGDLEASLNFDLDRLSQRLDAYVDLSGVRMSGGGWVNLDWKRDKKNAFALDADLQISGLKLSMGERKQWSEDKITATLKATGRTDFQYEYRLDTTEVDVRVGADILKAALTNPVPKIRADAVWPVRIDAQGKMADWLTRAKSWVSIEDMNLAGDYRLHLDGSGSAGGVSVNECKLEVDNLNMSGYGLNVSEPHAQLRLSGQYGHDGRRMLVKNAELNCPTVRLQGESLILGMPQDKPLEMAGDIYCQGDLARLQQWLADPKTRQTWRVGGKLSGQGRLKQVSDVTAGNITASIENLTAVNAAGQQVAEPKVQIVADGVYENSKRLLTFDKLALASQAVSADLKGKVDAAEPGNGNAAANATVDGRIQYDMEKLTSLLRPYLGEGVFVVGSGSRPVSFRGPLDLAHGQGRAGLNWQQAYVYGFRVGSGQMNLSLQDGALMLEPLSLPVNQGQVNLGAELKLSPGPARLNVSPGMLVQQVRIDPNMCAHGLQYIAPVLAGVTAAEGQFSIDLDECQIPLDNPSAGRLAGRFTVHSVQIGPGPLTRELAAVLLPDTSSAQLARESVIHFQLANGRVYHDGLELQLPNLTIRTKGSVGLDQTLSMVAEMPVPPAWTRDPRIAAAVSGEIISLPINGTLARPQIDRRKLAEYTQKFTQRAARNAIENEVGNQLNRLFGPRK